MKKISLKNKKAAWVKAKVLFTFDFFGDKLRSRVTRAVKTVAVPADLESKVTDLLWKQL